jgi:hypothetical protein
MTNPEINNKPFLRALKCAYKLHKVGGLSTCATIRYLDEAESAIAKGHPLPPASTPVADLLPATFNFKDSIMGSGYWQEIQNELQGAA